MSRPEKIHLPRHLLAAMVEHAKSEAPLECCGLLSGFRSGDVLLVKACYPLVNEAASPNEYRSEPRSMFRATKAIREHGQEILAIYHSHPTSDPIPSKTDRERNYSPDVANFIIGLKSTPADVRGWWLTLESFEEAGWDVVESSVP